MTEKIKTLNYVKVVAGNHQEENYKTKKNFPEKELTYLLTLPGNKVVMYNCSATISLPTRS